MKMSMWFNEMK